MKWLKAGAANRSIAEYQLVDRTWFCLELTRCLRRPFFNQYFVLLHFLLVTLLPTGRSRDIKKFSLSISADDKLATTDLKFYCFIYIFEFFSAPSPLIATAHTVGGFNISFSSVPGASSYKVSVVARHNSSDSQNIQLEENATMVFSLKSSFYYFFAKHIRFYWSFTWA